MIVKSRFALMSILFVASAIAVQADEVIPKQPDFSRYAAMLKRSPFAVASAPMPSANTPSWSKDLYVANAAHTAEVDLVTVMSLSDKNLKQYLSTEGPNKDGYGVANIQWSDSPGETKVTISRNGQFATIGFNEALLQQQQYNHAPPLMPPAPGSLKSGYRAMPRPVQTMPNPHVRGVIPRNPGLKTGPQPVPPTNQVPPPIPPGA